MTGQEIFAAFIRLSDAWQATDPATRGDAPSLVKMIDEAIENVASELGRRGGLKGGPARAKKLSKNEIRSISQYAAKCRWNKKT